MSEEELREIRKRVTAYEAGPADAYDVLAVAECAPRLLAEIDRLRQHKIHVALQCSCGKICAAYVSANHDAFADYGQKEEASAQ